MKRLVAVFSLALAIPLAAAEAQTSTDPTITEDRGIQDKAKSDLPGNSGSGASTADSTAKPTDSSITEKQKTDSGVKADSGTTAAPAAKPMDSSLTEKQKKDAGTP